MKLSLVTLVLGCTLCLLVLPSSTNAKASKKETGTNKSLEASNGEFLPLSMIFTAIRDALKALLKELLNKIGVSTSSAQTLVQKIIFGVLTKIDITKKNYQKYIDDIIDGMVKAFPEGKLAGTKGDVNKGFIEICVMPKSKDIQEYVTEAIKLTYDTIIQKKGLFKPLLASGSVIFNLVLKFIDNVTNSVNLSDATLNEDIATMAKSVGSIVKSISDIEHSLAPDMAKLIEKKAILHKKKMSIISFIGACTAAKLNLF